MSCKQFLNSLLWYNFYWHHNFTPKLVPKRKLYYVLSLNLTFCQVRFLLKILLPISSFTWGNAGGYEDNLKDDVFLFTQQSECHYATRIQKLKEGLFSSFCKVARRHHSNNIANTSFLKAFKLLYIAISKFLRIRTFFSPQLRGWVQKGHFLVALFQNSQS